MHNTFQFGPFIAYYYPVWFGASPWSHQVQEPNNLQITPSFLPSASIQDSIKIQSPRTLDTSRPSMVAVAQIVRPQATRSLNENQLKQEEQKIEKGKQSEANASEKAINSLKPKRPLTYLTEKSYYMKQKLKGKLKCHSRILRKRGLSSSQACIKKKLRGSAKMGASTKSDQKITKKPRLIKLGQKQKLAGRGVMLNLIGKHEETTASIPYLIVGVHNLNAFILQKLEGLKQRNYNKK